MRLQRGGEVAFGAGVFSLALGLLVLAFGRLSAPVTRETVAVASLPMAVAVHSPAPAVRVARITIVAPIVRAVRPKVAVAKRFPRQTTPRVAQSIRARRIPRESSVALVPAIHRRLVKPAPVAPVFIATRPVRVIHDQRRSPRATTHETTRRIVLAIREPAHPKPALDPTPEPPIGYDPAPALLRAVPALAPTGAP